jgi:hypothetical protein
MSTKPLNNGEARCWRELASTHPLGMAILAGIVATHIATITGFWYHGIGLPDLDWPRFNGYLLVRSGVLAAGGKVPTDVFAAADTTRLLLGWVAQTLTGVVFTVVYVTAIRPRLPWSNSARGNLAKALFWGLVLATISALWWTPALFPEFHAGFFSSNLGWKTVVGIYLWHTIWAVHVAVIYNPLPAEEPAVAPSASAPADVDVTRSSLARA